MTNDIEKIQEIQRTLYNYMKGAFLLKGFWNHKIRQQIRWISAAAPDSIAQGSGKSGAAQAWRLRPDRELVG